jgi:hypothetical protein
MISSLRHFLGWVVGAFRSRENLILENLALRQQLLALHTRRPRRRLSTMHKLFWIALRRLWTGWKELLILVHAENGCGLASGGFPPVLEMALRSQALGRQKTCGPGDLGLDLSYGGRESNLGSTAHSAAA